MGVGWEKGKEEVLGKSFFRFPDQIRGRDVR